MSIITHLYGFCVPPTFSGAKHSMALAMRAPRFRGSYRPFETQPEIDTPTKPAMWGELEACGTGKVFISRAPMRCGHPMADGNKILNSASIRRVVCPLQNARRSGLSVNFDLL